MGKFEKVGAIGAVLFFASAFYIFGDSGFERIFLGEYINAIIRWIASVVSAIFFIALSYEISDAIMHSVPAEFGQFLKTGKYTST